LRDNAQETNFILNTFVVLADGLHKPLARIHCDLNVIILVVSTDTFDEAGRSEEIR
jgi:hypothetical protein